MNMNTNKTNIVYSTVLSKNIVNLYADYSRTIGDSNTPQFKRNQLFIRFCNACEKENHHPLETAIQIINSREN
jgi:hypothetical protein